MGRGGAGSEAYGLLLGDEFARSQTDAALLVGRAEFAGLERGIVAEGLVEQWFDQGSAAMGAEDETASFEPGQVAPDAGCGGADLVDQFLNGDVARAQESF